MYFELSLHDNKINPDKCAYPQTQCAHARAAFSWKSIQLFNTVTVPYQYQGNKNVSSSSEISN